ncbi:substrate-binding domain-containing protein [Niabella hibiscisoli]|uniref:substrate-binding domain-containing protein n=1 Tax=Niabella hibiscisoli TaxID=1825928 RepID=UPI001F10F9FB|nr:substrate-binding domain-containing protein [Niabella hibiscisoli]MCH5716312.1 substrate-binding domain-containing protein [Niabella hibiscisoli]
MPYLDYKEHVADAIAQMLKDGDEVDALVFATNSISVQALKVIHSRGIKVPDDLRIISFDESDTFEFFYSTITYIKQNLNEISEKAVQLLIKNINTSAPKTAKVIVPSSIVLGQSSK